VRDEALTGEFAGQPLSREIFKLVQGADAVMMYTLSKIDPPLNFAGFRTKPTLQRLRYQPQPRNLRKQTVHHEVEDTLMGALSV
jgi:hypothetical protein